MSDRWDERAARVHKALRESFAAAMSSGSWDDYHERIEHANRAIWKMAQRAKNAREVEQPPPPRTVWEAMERNNRESVEAEYKRLRWSEGSPSGPLSLQQLGEEAGMSPYHTFKPYALAHYDLRRISAEKWTVDLSLVPASLAERIERKFADLTDAIREHNAATRARHAKR